MRDYVGHYGDGTIMTISEVPKEAIEFALSAARHEDIAYAAALNGCEPENLLERLRIELVIRSLNAA